jgi:6-pyruvoyltetrahydropterin/6-carboxytetrahydropterin synthase
MLAQLDFTFSCAHLYAQEKWDREKNKSVFGKCFSPFGHGHNYELSLTIEHQIDDQFGLLENHRDILKYQEAIKNILDQVDHKHLNFDLVEFKTKVPTTENISLYLIRELQNIPKLRLKKLLLRELNSLWVEIQL